MSTLTVAEIAPSAVATEREKLREVTQHVQDLEIQLDALQSELKTARARRDQLRWSVQWRELMAAVNADENVYAVVERLMDAFAAFRESLVEPENYQREQRDELLQGQYIVPYSDTDDYADFSGVEAAVEELLTGVKENLEANTAVLPLSFRSSNRGSPSGSLVFTGNPQNSTGQSPDKERSAVRRQALLKLLVITVLVGQIGQHCGFESIPDPSDIPQSEAEDIRDGVASVWHWLFHEHPGVLTASESAEWKDIVSTFLGESYAVGV
ncbi:hypothetical protein JKF63_00501 [Porcisia hertigi]|uniref:Uncharacterized protein n=1 Tax=Porcisia hertigi TaxID=2761500 RepID=A0A836HBR0_9TRYP|nr:hypothetical protein JKF63_00501 [Porcisia hertigi]